MFSLKDSIRRAITVTIASALATAVFVGCTNSTESINSQELTSAVIDELTPGITENSEAGGFSIKYKYWYENADVAEAQSNHLAATVSTAAKSTGFNFLDLDGLPIYQDSEGNQYIISGRTRVYLSDGKISGSEALLLRDEHGNKIYFTLDDPLTMMERAKEFAEAIKKEGKAQPETYEERIAASTSCTETSALVGMPVYVNNLETQLTVDGNGMIAIRPIYAETTLGEVEESTDGAVVTMYTAAGFVKVTFTAESTDLINVEYSTLIEKTTLTNEDADVYSGLLSLTPDAIERILGYDVEVYDNFVNIVTDNRDLFSSSPILPYYDSSESIDSERSVDIDDLDKDNPIPESKPIEKPKDETKPVEPVDTSKVVNPSLVGHEYQNPDGTYSLKPEAGMVRPGTGDTITEKNISRWKQNGSNGASNPSKIPYSEITVENAAEAFPYLGDFIGYVPDYIEIFPDMTKEDIITVIAQNFAGLKPMNAETHEHYLYSSAADWEAELARREENRKWQEETGKKDEEERARGDKIGGDDDFDDLTEEEKQILLDRSSRFD